MKYYLQSSFGLSELTEEKRISERYIDGNKLVGRLKCETIDW